jgi:acyl-CoA dehydrogenase
MSQFTVPQMALRVIDRAMQVHGAEGISQDTPLAAFYAGVRTLRFADVSGSVWKEGAGVGRKLMFSQGPDEVHVQQIGKQELKRVEILQAREAAVKRKAAALIKEAGLAKAKLWTRDSILYASSFDLDLTLYIHV